MPLHGDGFVLAKPGDAAHFGTQRLVALLAEAARSVAHAYPGTAPLYIGDLSSPEGGRHARHGSHRSGRDVDLLFYMLDSAGRSLRGSGFFAFDERGVSFVEAQTAPLSGLGFFDDARNWQLVRTLLLDRSAPVQWIFCANGIKARLLAYARVHEPDARLLVWASYVLHQPSSGNPHRDHFHVRINCSADERSRGCEDRGPVWRWQRDESEKPSWEGAGLDDATLVRALLDDRSTLLSLRE